MGIRARVNAAQPLRFEQPCVDDVSHSAFERSSRFGLRQPPFAASRAREVVSAKTFRDRRRRFHFDAESGTIPVTVSSTFSDDTRPHFAVQDEEVDATTHVVDVAGEVDLYSAPELKAHVLDAIDGGKTKIVVDLTNTTFIDSTTLGVLVGARKRLREHDGILAVVCPDPDKLGLFEMTGLDRVFSIHADRASALAAVQS